MKNYTSQECLLKANDIISVCVTKSLKEETKKTQLSFLRNGKFDRLFGAQFDGEGLKSGKHCLKDFDQYYWFFAMSCALCRCKGYNGFHFKVSLSLA